MKITQERLSPLVTAFSGAEASAASRPLPRPTLDVAISYAPHFVDIAGHINAAARRTAREMKMLLTSLHTRPRIARHDEAITSAASRAEFMREHELYRFSAFGEYQNTATLALSFRQRQTGRCPPRIAVQAKG